MRTPAPLIAAAIAFGTFYLRGIWRLFLLRARWLLLALRLLRAGRSLLLRTLLLALSE
jgi:hypothetical protein